ncbi:MAG: carbohydrate porin [Planctomycetota bacterium]
MKSRTLSATWIVLFYCSGLLQAQTVDGENVVSDAPQPDRSGSFTDDIVGRDTLTDNWFGFGDKLVQRGIWVGLGTTNVYQVNTHGGISTHDREDRFTGSYDLEVEFDLETLLNLPDAILYAYAVGNYNDGIDPESIGSAVGNVNADAAGDQAIMLAELYYQQALLDGRLMIKIGKMDLAGGYECKDCPGSFDGNSYANDEATQFLNAALVNNPTIPFPDYALGVMAHYEFLDSLYVSAAVGDAQADGRETGFNTAFHDEDYFFSIFEFGYTPRIACPRGGLQGAYRVGVWYDPQDKTRFTAGTTKRDDVGFYFSADQKIYNENADRDGQGMGVFARFGWADDDINAVSLFWSAGLQYQGLVPQRDDDVLAFGVASGKLTQAAGFTDAWETVYELYYSLQLTGWLQITPSVQYIQDPGAADAAKDALVAGLRLHLTF